MSTTYVVVSFTVGVLLLVAGLLALTRRRAAGKAPACVAATWAPSVPA